MILFPTSIPVTSIGKTRKSKKSLSNNYPHKKKIKHVDKHTYTCGIVDRKDIKRAVIDSVKESNATPQQQREAGMRQSLGKKSGKYM